MSTKHEQLRSNASRSYSDPDKTDAMLRDTILSACDEIERLTAEVAEKDDLLDNQDEREKELYWRKQYEEACIAWGKRYEEWEATTAALVEALEWWLDERPRATSIEIEERWVRDRDTITRANAFIIVKRPRK